MEKHLQRNISEVLERNPPSCIWGIFHILNFHHRHSRKLISHGRGKSARGIKVSRKKQNVPGDDECSLMEGVDYCHIEDTMEQTCPTSKRSGKTRVKTLIAEEMSKEHNWKQSLRATLTRTDSIHHMEDADADLITESTAENKSPRIEMHQQDTNTSVSSSSDPLPIQYNEDPMGCSKQCEVCGTLNRPYLGCNQLDDFGRLLLEKNEVLQEKIVEAKQVLLKQNCTDGKEHTRDITLCQTKEFLDALEIFNANRELFLKILQDPNALLASHFHIGPSAEALLTKSGSFPGADSSVQRNIGRIKLKSKRKDISSLPQHERELQALNSQDVLDTVDSFDGNYADSMAVTANEGSSSYQFPTGSYVHRTGGGSINLESLPGSPHELKNRQDQGTVKNRFKDIRQKIKHAIRESKTERLRIAMDGILHRIPYGRKASRDVKHGMDSTRSGCESDFSASSSGKDALSHLRRTPSLTESLERYSVLLEPNLSRDSSRLPERLKLAHEDGDVQDGHARKSFKRVLSLPELESHFLGREFRDVESEVPQDKFHNTELSTGIVDCSSEYHPDEPKLVNTLTNTENSHLDSLTEAIQDQYVNTSNLNEGAINQLPLAIQVGENSVVVGIGDESDDLTLAEASNIPLHEEPTSAINACSKPAQPSPISVLVPHFQEDVPSPAKLSVSEAASQFQPRHINFDELDSSVNSDDQLAVKAQDGANNTTYADELQIPHKCTHLNSLRFQVDTKDEADFNYVKDILKISGFSGDESLGMWYSPEQPVDPVLFEEVEASPVKHDMCGEEVTCCDHLLLFDLINEVLLEIYDRSFSYYPWPQFFNSHIRPMPVGYRVLEEVWKCISCHLSSQPALHESLECVVSRDFAKNDGWMNLHFDMECVMLELEDWILDDLLVEEILEITA